MSNDITAACPRPVPQAQELPRPVKADPIQDPQAVKAARATEEAAKRIDPEASRRDLEKAMPQKQNRWGSLKLKTAFWIGFISTQM